MTGMLTAEAIIFAIRSAIKLGSAFEKAYANSLKGKKMVLPLPNVQMDLNFDTAERFFRRGDGQPFVKQVEQLEKLHTIAENQGENALSEEQRQDYLGYYTYFFKVVNGTPGDSANNMAPTVSASDLVGLMRIRQWELGKVPVTSPLQLVAGTLVEIGIDYFQQVPGALHTNSTVATFVHSFLKAFDNIDFAEGKDLKKVLVKQVVPQMFISVAETLPELSKELSADPKLQLFVESTSQGIAKDLYRRIDALGTDGDQETVLQWGQLVFRSLIKNSGHYIFDAPSSTLGVGQKEGKLIQAVGDSIMSALLDPNPEGVSLKNVFSLNTLDEVVKASLTVVAQYPSLISNRDGIKEIVQGVAAAVAKSGIQQKGLVPELVRLVLINTAGNLNQLWNIKDPNAKHLLVVTLNQFLTTLAAKPTTGVWRPQLTKNQIVSLAEFTLNEVISNPAWIEAKVNSNSLLSEVLDTTFTALGKVPEGQRLNFLTLQGLIEINLRTVATSQRVLSKIKWGNAQEETTILNKALDLIFAFTFTGTHQKSGDRTALLFNLMNYVMDVLVAQHPNTKGLVLTQLVLSANAGVIEDNGINRDLANQLVKATLGVISAHPNLLSNDAILQNIIGGVATAFEQSGINQPGLLPEFIRITLINVSGNLNLMLPSQTGQPKHLLVTALEQTLNTITAKPNPGKWKPTLTGTEILGISETILNEVVQNPTWITTKVNQDSLLQEVLSTTFTALEKIPEGQRLNFPTLESLIQLNLHTAASNSLVLSKIRWGTGQEETTILNKALDIVFASVFQKTSIADKATLLIQLADYVMGSVVRQHPNSNGLLLTQLIVSADAGVVESGGFNKNTADNLVKATLGVLSAHPDLVAHDSVLQNIIGGVASAFQQSGIRQPGLLPEFIRITLINVSGNLNDLVPSSDGTPKHLLVVALQQILPILTSKPAPGKWKPTLTGTQVLAISETLLDDVVKNPNWIKQKVNQDSLLGEVLNTTFETLANIPAGQRIDFETLEQLIEINLRLVAISNLVLNKIKWGNAQQETTILSKSLDLVFAYVFAQDSTVDKSELLTELLDYVFMVILANHPNEAAVVVIFGLLQKELGIITTSGVNEDLANEFATTALNVLLEHPELISKNDAIQNIVQGVASSLAQRKITDPGMVAEFIRLVLENTAGNLELITDTSRRTQKNILILALQQILRAMSSRPTAGNKWRPKLTTQQIYLITQNVLQEVIANPQWIENDLVRILITALYRSMEAVPSDKPLHYTTVELLIEEAMKAVNIRKQLAVSLIAEDGGTQQLAVQYSLNGLFVALYDESGGTVGTWTLTQTPAINAITEAFLMYIAGQPVTKENLDEAVDKIKKAMTDLNNNAAFSLEELLTSLGEV